jgi:hypothetical protein
MQQDASLYVRLNVGASDHQVGWLQVSADKQQKQGIAIGEGVWAATYGLSAESLSGRAAINNILM